MSAISKLKSHRQSLLIEKQAIAGDLSQAEHRLETLNTKLWQINDELTNLTNALVTLGASV
jgi:primosomal protein N''